MSAYLCDLLVVADRRWVRAVLALAGRAGHRHGELKQRAAVLHVGLGQECSQGGRQRQREEQGQRQGQGRCCFTKAR